MSWLSSAWDRNRNFLGNAVKNIAPLAAFTPLGVLGSGALGALGSSMHKGTNFGDIVKSGVSNAAIGGGARGLVGAAQGAMGAGAAPGMQMPGVQVTGANTAMQGPGAAAINAPFTNGMAAGASGAGVSPSVSSQLLSGLKGAGNFAKDNATMLGNAGGALLNTREHGAELDFQRQQYEDEQKRKQRIADLLGPMYQQMQTTQRNIAPNPYTGGM